MLVLSRKQAESILIGGNIEIKVLRIQGNAIRLGINAPKDITITRAELIAPGGRETSRQIGAMEDFEVGPEMKRVRSTRVG